MSAMIALEDVTFTFGGPLILERVSLEVADKEFLGLVGPNGGGKSTLLKIVLGLLQPTSGKAWIAGKPPAKARVLMGYVPQHARYPKDFPITVEETVLMGRLGKTRLIGGYLPSDHAIARQTMEAVGVLSLSRRPIGSLSGGELQRTLIARALASEPKLLLLDEPTAGIDPGGVREIFDFLATLTSRMTIVVVSHDIGFISRYVTRVACLNRTLICHQTQAITGEIIEKLYGMPVRIIRHDQKDET